MIAREFFLLSSFFAMSINVSASFLKPVSSLLEGEKAVMAVKLFPNSLDEGVVPTPKHLAVTIDTSGSMEGRRLATVKRTLHLLVDALPESNKITVIQYNSSSSFVLESAVLGTDRAPIHSAIDTLEADGGTNLESAVLLLKDLLTRTHVDSVFILTDGHINEGIKAGNGLLRLLGADIPPLNTLGFGADYNVMTLKTLSVATRGSHTYADADELIPAIIGDIVGGLASEVGSKGVLQLPPGWRCLELGSDDSLASYSVGTLVAEKEQWVVLEAPVGLTAADVPTHLAFSFLDATLTKRDLAIEVSSFIQKEVVSEQHCRTLVANTYGTVTDLMDRGLYVNAKQALDDLSTRLKASLAKDRPFVIRLLAQVDEMLEEFRRPSGRMNPGVAPRMASNQVALGVQRGIVSRIQSSGPSDDDPATRQLTGVYDTFSSPAQRSATASMSNHYSQQEAEDQHNVVPVSPVSPVAPPPRSNAGGYHVARC